MVDKDVNGSVLKELEKVSLSEKTIHDMASIFRALADPTRIRIIHTLTKSEMCVHELSHVLNMTQSAISHQLRYLKNLRIVKRRKEGRSAFYSIDDEHILTLLITGFQHASHE